MPPRPVGARGDRARDGLAGDETNGWKSQPALGEMGQQIGDAAAGSHGNAPFVVTHADPAQMAQVQEHIGCLDGAVPGMTRADDTHGSVSVPVQDPQDFSLVPRFVPVAGLETDVSSEVGYRGRSRRTGG